MRRTRKSRIPLHPEQGDQASFHEQLDLILVGLIISRGKSEIVCVCDLHIIHSKLDFY